MQQCPYDLRVVRLIAALFLGGYPLLARAYDHAAPATRHADVVVHGSTPGGFAAALAARHDVPVQAVPYPAFRARMQAQGQVLALPSQEAARGPTAMPPTSIRAPLPGPCVAAESLYTQDGSDAAFAEVLAGSGVEPGNRFSKGPVLGSRIRVNHELLEKQTGKTGSIPKEIGIHTQICGDSIGRKDFGKWTRWYQEDGNVQVFRLFKGEQNVRGGSGTNGSPGRIEAYSKSMTVAPGTWREWEGTYTIIKPVGGCIFQLMHEGSLWPFHIEMSSKGDISFLRRRPVPGMEREVAIARDMVGKSISIKVRANGADYEVYQKAPLAEGPWETVAKGTFTQATNGKISFRWGIYCGSKKGELVKNDALLFVSGVSIR